MLIGILENGVRSAQPCSSFGSNADMIERLLRAASPDFTFKRYCVRGGVFPASPTECEGWIATGSNHSVYEELPWMLRLESFLKDALALHRPVVGICFGHQILAKAMGGIVQKSEKGWGLGLHEYQLHDSGETICLPAYHQDQVITPPPAAKVLGGSEFCPHAVLDYDGRALTFQAHPEFTADYLEVLIDEDLAGKPEHVALVGRARQSLCATSDCTSVGRWIGDFLSAHQSPPLITTGSPDTT